MTYSKFGYKSKSYSHKENTFDTYILLDHETITANNSIDDLIFISIQPHTITGSVIIDITWRDDNITTYNANIGDNLRIDCKSITITYYSKGGVSISVWNLPKTVCPDYSIVTMNQKEIKLDINRNINASNICWFVNFISKPHFVIKKLNLPTDTSLHIYNSTNNPQNIDDKEFYTTNQALIALNHISSNISFLINIKSAAIYGDWTDSPRNFYELTKNGINFIPTLSSSYMITNRSVSPLIWIVYALIAFAIFGVTVYVFFFKSIQKMHRKIRVVDLAKDFKFD